MSLLLTESERLKALIYGLLGVEPQALLGWGVCLLSAQEGRGKATQIPRKEPTRCFGLLFSPISVPLIFLTGEEKY